MQERWRAWSVVQAWTSCRVQASFCRTGVGSNSIFCNGCKHWVHKKCSGFKRLTNDPDYICTRCQGTAAPWTTDNRGVQVGPEDLDVVASFCYLGDMPSAADGCELSSTTRVKTAWKKFKELLPVLFSRQLSFKTRGRVNSSKIRWWCKMIRIQIRVNLWILGILMSRHDDIHHFKGLSRK